MRFAVNIFVLILPAYYACCIYSNVLQTILIMEANTMNPGPEVIKLFSCSTQLRTIFILLVNIKMTTIVGILTFINMINIASKRLKAMNFFTCRYFSFL